MNIEIDNEKLKDGNTIFLFKYADEITSDNITFYGYSLFMPHIKAQTVVYDLEKY